MFGGSEDPPFLLSCFAEEEQCQHAGTHMSAGEGLVGTYNQLFRLADLAAPLGEELCLFRTVTVGDGNSLLFGKQGRVYVAQNRNLKVFTSHSYLNIL